MEFVIKSVVNIERKGDKVEKAKGGVSLEEFRTIWKILPSEITWVYSNLCQYTIMHLGYPF